MNTGEAKTLLIPPPPKARGTKSFEYQESGFEHDLSDHVERSLAKTAGDYASQPMTEMEAVDLSQQLRRIFLRWFGKGGMIL